MYEINVPTNIGNLGVYGNPYNWQTEPMAQAEGALNRMFDLADYNSARSAQQAEIQREWQEQQNAKAMMFNESEAAKNRDWQEYMSNTAHQREVRDLVAAGLNPILSVTGGNGAPVTSGAAAQGVTSAGSKGDVDMSLDQAFVSLLGTAYANQTKLQETAMSAIAALANTDKTLEIQKYLGEAQLNTAIQNALVAAGASRDVARINFASAGNVADIYTQMEYFLKKNYPDTFMGLLNTVADELFGGTGSAIRQMADAITAFFDQHTDNTGSGGRTFDNDKPIIKNKAKEKELANKIKLQLDNSKNINPGQ